MHCKCYLLKQTKTNNQTYSAGICVVKPAVQVFLPLCDIRVHQSNNLQEEAALLSGCSCMQSSVTFIRRRGSVRQAVRNRLCS